METIKKHLPQKAGFQNETSKNFPLLILVAATSPCNARCPYCPSEVNRDIRKTTGLEHKQENWLRFEYYQKLADECAKYDTRIRISSYGEPMLHPKFMELVEYSCGLGVKTSIITNGSLLTPEKSERMMRCGIESIEVSIESHREDLYRKLKIGLNFQKTLSHFKTLREIRDRLHAKTFIIASIVNVPNINTEIEEAKKFYAAIADHVSVRSFLTWGLPELVQIGKNRELYLEEESPCPYPFERCMIDPAGFIRLCPYDDQKKIPPFGHIATHSIAEIWQGKRWREIRSCHQEVFDKELSREKAPLCGECEDRRNRSWTHNFISIAEKCANT